MVEAEWNEEIFVLRTNRVSVEENINDNSIE